MDTSQALDPKFEQLLKRFSEELIQYTPEYFKEIHCVLRKGSQDGQDALFYEISCPQYPAESTTNPSRGLHSAAIAMVNHWDGTGTPFPGVKLVCSIDDDGTWQNTLEPLKAK